MKETAMLAVRIPADLKIRIFDAAAADGRSAASWLERHFIEYFAKGKQWSTPTPSSGPGPLASGLFSSSPQ